MRLLRLIRLTSAIGAIAAGALTIPTLRWTFLRSASGSVFSLSRGELNYNWNPRRADWSWPWHGWETQSIEPAFRWRPALRLPSASTNLIGGWRYLRLPLWPLVPVLVALAIGAHVVARRRTNESRPTNRFVQRPESPSV
jgi:hypothetical protein